MEIMVLGDGRFVHAVLNGVAMVQGYATLGALGGLVGLLVMAFKGAMSPQGPSFNPMSVLISLIIFMIMFGTRADRVMVVEVMPPPGGTAPRTYVVDNVPFGLAAAGYFVSNVGLGITGLYDTVMGRPTDEERVLTGGLGRNLMLLSSLREMVADPRFGEANLSPDGQAGEYDYYRSNMISYMADCVSPPIKSGYVPAALPMNASLDDGVFSEKFALRARDTLYATPGPSGYAEKEAISCADANARLKAGKDSGALLESFDKAAEKGKLKTNALEISRAFAQTASNDAVAAQELVVGHMVSALWAEAELRGSLSPMDRQALVMLEEANMRRTTQWAAEENLFVRLLRPIVGFFEALFYALAPVMAFVVMLGQVGWGLVVKYLMLTVWVALWFPMLTITQLYSKIRMEDYFAQLGSLDRYSPRDLELIANEAMNTLGATSALVAATPALAMSLIYGGAVSMSYLAGRLQHSDVVDETKMAPMASQIAPVHQAAGISESNAGSGAMMVGRSGFTFDASAVAQRSVSSSEARATELAFAAQRETFEAVSAGYKLSTSGGTYGQSSETMAAGGAIKDALSNTEALSHSEREGAALLKGLSSDQTAFAAVANQYAKSSGLSFGAAAAQLGMTMGLKEDYVKSITNTVQSSDNTSEQTRLSNEKAISDALEYGTKKDHATEATLARGFASEAGQRFASMGEATQSTETGQRLANAFREADTARLTYESAKSDTHQIGLKGQTHGAEVLKRLSDDGKLDDFNRHAARIISAAGPEAAQAYQANRAAADAAHFAGDDERVGFASLKTLYDGKGMPETMRADADALLALAFGGSTLAGNGVAMMGRASENDGVGLGAYAAIGTKYQTDHVVGPGIDAAPVAAAVQGRIGAAQGTVSADSGELAGRTASVPTSAAGFDEQWTAMKDGHHGRAAEGREAHAATTGWDTVQAEKLETINHDVKQLVENNYPIGAQEGTATVRDWAAVVNTMTKNADAYERLGFKEQAEQVRTAREETIAGMTEQARAEARHHVYPGQVEQASNGALSTVVAAPAVSAAARAVSDNWGPDGNWDNVMTQFSADMGAPGTFDSAGQVQAREALMAAGYAGDSPEVREINLRLPAQLQPNANGVVLPQSPPMSQIRN